MSGEEEEEEGKGEDQLLVGRGCAPLAAAEPRGLSERNRLKRRTWEFPQYFRPLKKTGPESAFHSVFPSNAVIIKSFHKKGLKCLI